MELSAMKTARQKRPDGETVEQDPRWGRILARDKASDGQFWYSGSSTGVYCRPSCPSRTCNPKNVAIHGSLAAAQATGSRACRRCRPDETLAKAGNDMAVAKACRLIEAAVQAPSLASLAAAVALSPFHFHRLFKAATGLTPKAYADACRATRVRANLVTSRTVTEAVYDAGFNASSRFYAQSAGCLGMTPRHYRAGGAREELQFAIGACWLGAILVAATAKGVAAILIGDDPEALARDLRDRFPRATLVAGDADYAALLAQVLQLVEAPHAGSPLPLDISGTAFQQRVWQALREIPAGQTMSYSAVAARLGAPNAARAVAGACAANRLAVAIPCHRVVRDDGALAGYRWTVERKRRLLEREMAPPELPTRP